MHEFLRHIFRDAVTAHRRLVIFTAPDIRSRLFASLAEAAAYAHGLADRQDVYYGLGLIQGEPSGRGKLEDIGALGTLWADIDLAGSAHPGKQLPASLDDIRSLLGSLPLPPSMIIDSGHGVHAYWLLAEPWLLESAEQRAEAARLCKGWHAAVCNAAASRGWALENLGDPTRVLRLPGTVNHKIQDQPVPVRVLSCDPQLRYAPERFWPHLPPHQPDCSAAATGVLVLTPDALPPPDKFQQAMTESPQFRRTWDRNRDDLADSSQSGYDLSLATIAALRGWSDQEIANLIIAARRAHAKNPAKALREDYVQRTIQRARSAAQAESGPTVDLSGIAPAQPSEDLPEIRPDGVPRDPGPLPASLLEVPGFVRQVMDYTLETAPYPQVVMAFAAALALQAFLAGRKVRDAADNRTSLYILALANSGVGKDHPRKINQRICIEVGLQDHLGDTFASGEGIEDRMFLSPSLLFQTDEIDGLMASINRAGDARHENIMNVLLKMYTSSSTLYPMRVKAGKQSPGTIDQPSLCLLGTAVPKYFYESLSVRMLNNGFFARLLILDAGKRGAGQENVTTPVPEPILATARWWAEFQPGDHRGNLQTWHPRPAIVPATPDATEILGAGRVLADERYAEAEEKDDPAGMAIWARAHEKARKLALIYAISESHSNPSIGANAADWAWRFVEYQTRRMLFMAHQHVADGEFDGRCKRMIEVLAAWREKRGEAWMPHWYLARLLRWSTKEIEEVRTALVGQYRVAYEVGTTPEGGKPGQKYRLLV